MRDVQTIYGIDFSGAKDAGNKIWLAKGAAEAKRLLIKQCIRARDLTSSGKELEDCLPALVNLVKSETNAVFGFDFPFGLPGRLVREKSWKDFVLGFPRWYERPETLREACRRKKPRHELKRETDIESHTPFSPYNLRLYKQTYYGISKVLFPLVRDRIACIVPFRKPVQGEPWILEVCPASTLKRLMKDGVPSYKGHGEDKRENRRMIMDAVMKAGVAFGTGAALKEKIIANKGGDALDTVIAALAVFNTMQTKSWAPPDEKEYLIEGYVYH